MITSSYSPEIVRILFEMKKNKKTIPYFKSIFLSALQIFVKHIFIIHIIVSLYTKVY